MAKVQIDLEWSPHPKSGGVRVAREIEESGWWVSALLVPHRGQLAVAELKVYPRDDMTRKIGAWSERPQALDKFPDGGVTSRLLRRVRVGQLIEKAYESAETARELLPGDVYGSLVSKAFDTATRQAPARPGRAGRHDAYYAVWAARYASKRGSKRPNAELAEDYILSPSQVRDLIHEARRRELLTPARPGRPGGSLTRKAQLLLNEIQAQERAASAKRSRSRTRRAR